jgi:hypothetical protein
MRSAVATGLALMILGVAVVARRVNPNPPSRAKTPDVAVPNAERREIPPAVGAAVVVGGLTLVAIGALRKPV